jgi:hypothetical protein
MNEAPAAQPTLCRTVTAEEINHFHEFGWVQLKKFVDPNTVNAILEVGRNLMGDDADSNAPSKSLEERLGLRPTGRDGSRPGEQSRPKIVEKGQGHPHFNPQYGGGLSNPILRPLIYEVGQNAKQLQHRASNDGRGVGVRYYADVFGPKLPSSRASRHGGNSPTAFHQDFISHAVDRSGGMTFWFALQAYGPEAGTMSFVSRSHRLGVLGHTMTYGEGDVLDGFPELRELEMSEPITYELGDVTAHDHLTVHGTGENRTDGPRWAYMLLTQPADVLWNGSPCPNFDWTAMSPWQPFGDDVMPVIS